METLVLYIREGCHLCDAAEQLLQNLYPETTLQLRDVDSRREWYEQFDIRVPVLEKASGETLDWPFDADALQTFLA